MSFPLLMPKIGLTMTEGKVVEWRKKPGDRIEKGEIVFVFETEKVAFDVEAPREGFLARIVADVEDVVPVGGTVALLTARAGEPLEEGAPAGAPAPAPAPAPPPVAAGPERSRDRVRASPMARRLARERGVDLGSLASGGERVSAADLARAAPAAAPAAAPGGRLVKASGMRRTIAERMLSAKRDTAQAYMALSVDATGLLRARERLGPAVAAEGGARLGLTDLLLKVTAAAVAAHPVMHRRWTADGILEPDAVHLGMAMALEEGLIVPVLRDAAGRTLAGLAAERSRLVEQGRAGRLTPDDLRGSTFTVSSLGMLGVEEFSAILNPPESAILAVGAVVDRPVVVDGAVAVRPVMKLTLTYDHRVIDGADAARFLATLRKMLEAPAQVVG